MGLAKTIKVYACPIDGRVSTALVDSDGVVAAYASYIGVAGGRDRDGLLGLFRGGVRFSEVRDGLGNTLMVGERPPPDSLQAGKWYPRVWFGNGKWGLDLGPDGGMLMESPISPGSPCGGPFQFGPGRTSNSCDRFHFWSRHAHGANFLIADGSARFLSYQARPLMVSLATRAGGEAVQMPD